MEKTLKNYRIEGHTDQFVNREQLKIYRKKKKEKKIELRRLQSIGYYKCGGVKYRPVT